jgi:hypothetical protein
VAAADAAVDADRASIQAELTEYEERVIREHVAKVTPPTLEQHRHATENAPTVSLADLQRADDEAGDVLDWLDHDEITDPDCTCGLPIGHDGECR